MKPGDIVPTKIKKIGNYGVVVSLPNDYTGVIRPEELSWDSNFNVWENLEIGVEVPAKVVEYFPNEGRIILSRRLAERDPWDKIHEFYHLGDLVSFTITNILSREIVAEIEPGVNGVLPYSEIVPPKIKFDQIHDIFWLGDQTKGIIKSIDLRRRQILLSIKCAYEAYDEHFMNAFQLELSQKYTRMQEEKFNFQTTVRWPTKSTKSQKNLHTNVLIIDDNEKILISLGDQLKNFDYHVEVSCDGFDMNPLKFKVVFLDVDIPIRSGYQIAQDFIEKGFNPQRIIFMTGLTVETERFSEIAALGCAGLLFKPIPADRLEECIDLTLKKGEIPADLNMLSHLSTVSDLTESEFILPQMGSNGPETLKTLLTDLARYVIYSSCAVFEMDSDRFECRITEEIGVDIDRFQKQQHSLPHSPIKDVIVDGETLAPGLLQFNKSKFKNLLKIVGFTDCIAIPIITFEKRSHALFIFRNNSQSFTNLEFEFAKVVSKTISQFLEKEKKEEILRKQLPFIMLGHVLANIEHELNNQLSILTGMHNKIHHQLEHPQQTYNEDTLRGYLNEAQAATKTMEDVVKDFTKIVTDERRKTIDVNRMIFSVLNKLRFEMRTKKIKYTTILDDSLPRVYMVNVHLEQILFNIIHNAIQHLAQCKIEEKLISIRSFKQLNDDQPIKVEIIDNGWGIHKKHWQKIFQPGFSTKDNGTGMGLFICRDLGWKHGIKISIKESHILFGTTFLIELPEAQNGGSNE